MDVVNGFVNTLPSVGFIDEFTCNGLKYGRYKSQMDN